MKIKYESVASAVTLYFIREEHRIARNNNNNSHSTHYSEEHKTSAGFLFMFGSIAHLNDSQIAMAIQLLFYLWARFDNALHPRLPSRPCRRIHQASTRQKDS